MRNTSKRGTNWLPQGRNLRRTANIAANKKVKFILKPTRDLAAHDLEVLKLLLNAEAVEVNANYQPAKNTMTVRADIGRFVSAVGRFD